MRRTTLPGLLVVLSVTVSVAVVACGDDDRRGGGVDSGPGSDAGASADGSAPSDGGVGSDAGPTVDGGARPMARARS